MIRFSCLAESKTPPDLPDIKSEIKWIDQYHLRKTLRPFFLGSLPHVPAKVHGIQLLLALFRHMEMLIRMNINFFKFK